jgi:hypothetical protein
MTSEKGAKERIWLLRRNTAGQGIMEVAERQMGTRSDTDLVREERVELRKRKFQSVEPKALSKRHRIGVDLLFVQV